jgi:hypothetical protein
MSAQSLSHTARIAVMARIAHSVTICARHTYEVGTDKVLEPQVLRSYNDLLHRVIGAVVSHVTGSDDYSLESIVEMVQELEFGVRYNRDEEVNWFLNRALQQTESSVAPGSSGFLKSRSSTHLPGNPTILRHLPNNPSSIRPVSD